MPSANPTAFCQTLFGSTLSPTPARLCLLDQTSELIEIKRVLGLRPDTIGGHSLGLLDAGSTSGDARSRRNLQAMAHVQWSEPPQVPWGAIEINPPDP